LKTVTQGSQTRTFVYDSLSRLSSAANPESGTVTYTYDANGNLATKLAPAPNQTGSATVNTAYTYDALNRLTSKLYSDGVTSGAYYLYDQATVWGVSISNPLGRLTLATTNSSCVSEIFSYDAVGRVVKLWTGTPANCHIGSLPFTYGYDLAGDLTSLTYYNHTVTYAYNNAQEAVSAVDTANSINYATGACQPSSTSACYAPTGALSSVLNGKTGSFGGITASYTYNNRLEPSTAVISSSNATPLMRHCYG